MNKVIQSLSGAAADHFTNFLRDICLRENSSPDGIIHIMMNIGDLIGKSDDLAFQCMRLANGLMVPDTVTHFICQIQSLTVLFQNIHGTDTLLCVLESKRTDSVQSPLSRMSERCMSQIMPQCNCLHQILVQLQSLCYGSGCLGYLQCMRQSGPIVVSLRCQKHLCFILQSAECLTVDDTVSVPLKYRPDITLFLRLQPSL